MSDTYLVVGIHGAPTPETAPHGFMWLGFGDKWHSSDGRHDLRGPRTKWWPLPAPPTEQAPPPEPEPRWCFCLSDRGRRYVSLKGFDNPLPEECEAAADALNALDAHGVAWGPGRPMEELPDGHHPRVLLRADGGPYVEANTRRWDDADRKRLCWWPLPKEERHG